MEEIIAESIASDYDVIIMGTHGHGISAGAMMGSTGMRVVRRSHVPVMVVRLPKTAWCLYLHDAVLQCSKKSSG